MSTVLILGASSDMAVAIARKFAAAGHSIQLAARNVERLQPLRSDLDAYIERVNEQVTGEIGLKLYKGSVRVVTRSSPNAVYDASLASFAQSGGLFSQQASPGFIELWSLQSRMAYGIRNREQGEQ